MRFQDPLINISGRNQWITSNSSDIIITHTKIKSETNIFNWASLVILSHIQNFWDFSLLPFGHLRGTVRLRIVQNERFVFFSNEQAGCILNWSEVLLFLSWWKFYQKELEVQKWYIWFISNGLYVLFPMYVRFFIMDSMVYS